MIDRRASIASRKASQDAIEALQPLLPELLGGSADLSGSNLTEVKRQRTDPNRPLGQLHQLRRA